MMKENSYPLRRGITFRIFSTILVFVVIVLAIFIFVTTLLTENFVEIRMHDTSQEIFTYYESNDREEFDSYIEEFSTITNQVAVFKLNDNYKMDIITSNTEIDVDSELQSRIWSSLSAKKSFFQFSKSTAYYSSTNQFEDGYYVLIIHNAHNEYQELLKYTMTFLVITIIILIVCIFLSYVWGSNISSPIELATNSIVDLGASSKVRLKKSKYTEINELNKAIKDLLIELEEISKLDKDLLANTSHEFKTPLTLIKSYAEMIIDFSGEDRELREEHLKTIITEADHLTTLVNDILSLSRAQAKVETKSSIFSLSDLVENTLKSFTGLISMNNITLVKSIEDKVYINANYKQLCEVVYNYLSNGVKYTSTKVEVKLYFMEDRYRFEVTDDGPGIAQDEIDSIWNKYYRGKNKPTLNVGKSSKGTGLGLAIVKEILTSHNYPYGVITLEGEGSTFYFEILKEQK